METEPKSYLCESVLVQKELPKLSVPNRGERSQCRAAGSDSEEAGQLYSEGLCDGLDDVRASAPTAKHVSLSPQSLSWKVKRLTSRTIRVTGAISRRQGLLNHTGEVPHRFGPPVRIKRVYKATPKRPAYPMAQRRLFQPPLAWGCQQSQSNTPGPNRGAKGKTDREQEPLAVLMGIVSSADLRPPNGRSVPLSDNPVLAKKHPPTARKRVSCSP